MLTHQKIAVIILKFALCGFTMLWGKASKRCRRNDEQCRPWSDLSGSALFAQTYPFEYLGTLW